MACVPFLLPVDVVEDVFAAFDFVIMHVNEVCCSFGIFFSYSFLFDLMIFLETQYLVQIGKLVIGSCNQLFGNLRFLQFRDVIVHSLVN